MKDIQRSGTETDTNGDFPRRYLFTVDGNSPRKILPIVCSLVAEANADLLIGYPVEEREPPTLETPDPMREGTRIAAEYVWKATQECHSSTAIGSDVKRGDERDSIIKSMIETNGISTFITQEQPRSGIRSLLGFDVYGETSVPETCDTIIVGRVGERTSIDSVLVPVGTGPHSEYAIETGLALARQNDATLELVHVSEAGDEDARRRGENILARGGDKLRGYERSEQTILEADDVPAAIIDYTLPFDVTVFGAPQKGLLRQFMLGSVPQAVEGSATGTVLIAHKGGAKTSWVDRLI